LISSAQFHFVLNALRANQNSARAASSQESDDARNGFPTLLAASAFIRDLFIVQLAASSITAHIVIFSIRILIHNRFSINFNFSISVSTIVDVHATGCAAATQARCNQ
jgi:hypothetical protein